MFTFFHKAFFEARVFLETYYIISDKTTYYVNQTSSGNLAQETLKEFVL